MERVFIIVKPDGMDKKLLTLIKQEISLQGLDIRASLIIPPNEVKLRKHYEHISDTEFFEDVIEFMMGKYSVNKKLGIIIAYGEDAVEKCRKLAGATNPEDADMYSIRGRFGKIVEGRFENVMHVSSSVENAEREIKLWLGK